MPIASRAALPRLGWTAESGQVLRRADMHPVAVACHIQAGFILMQDLCPTEGGFDLLLHWCQLLGTTLHQPS